MKRGKLYLLPTPLGEDAVHALPQYLISTVHGLRYLVAERAKTARHFLKASGLPTPIQEYHIEELNKRTTAEDLPRLLAPIFQGHDLGVLSEAGCPGIADPGARLVALAHREDIEVVPFVGPSSLLLALMGSGMNGQSFAFHGYLPAKRGDLGSALRRLERDCSRQTQLFIETPYRNQQLFEEALNNLQNDTLLCLAMDLTLPTELVKTKRIQAWKKSGPPNLDKRPCVFLIGK